MYVIGYDYLSYAKKPGEHQEKTAHRFSLVRTLRFCPPLSIKATVYASLLLEEKVPS